MRNFYYEVFIFLNLLSFIVIIIIIKSLLAEKTVANYFTVLFDRSHTHTHTHTHTWYKKQFSHYLPTSTVKVTIVYNKSSSFSVFKATKVVRRKFVNKLYSDWVGGYAHTLADSCRDVVQTGCQELYHCLPMFKKD